MKTSLQMLGLTTALLLLLTSIAPAAETYWTGTVGDWSNPANWDNGEPNSSDNAYINNAGTAQISSPNDEYCSNLYLAENSDDSGTVDLTGGSLAVDKRLYVGRFGSGTLNITDGGVASSSDGLIGAIRGYFSATGEVTVDGPGSSWTNSVLGVGSGSLSITEGGAVSNATCHIGFVAGLTGEVTVDGIGSTWTNGYDLYVGGDGNGIVSITGGGTVNSTGNSTNRGGKRYLGYRSGSTGEVTVDGAGSTWTNSYCYFYVGYYGRGTLSVTDGGAVSSRTSSIGLKSGSTGVVTVDGAGSTWTINDYLEEEYSSLTIGVEGNGSLNITGGGVVRNSRGNIGGNYYVPPGSTGEVTVDGAGSTWTNDRLHVGLSGSGVLTITDGGLVSVAGGLAIDFDSNGDGFINMASGGMLALLGDTDDSLGDFLNLIDGTDAIRYWNDTISNWDDITNATEAVDYTLEYLTAGDLAGYTLLTVTAIPEPSTFAILFAGLISQLPVRRRSR